MAGDSLLTYTGQASIAYKDALDQARNTQNSLLRQYGFTLPGANGASSVENAQSAFDPNKLFNSQTGMVDEAKLKELSGQLQYGASGRLADVARMGASGEADAISEVRSRGLGGEIGGGLMNQRRNLAESIASGQMGAAKDEFIAGLGGALSPIGGAWQGLQTGMAQDAADLAAANASTATTSSSVLPNDGNSVGGKPRLSGGASGDFMTKMNNISKSKNKTAQINNLKSILGNYGLSNQQQNYINSMLKKLGG